MEAGRDPRMRIPTAVALLVTAIGGCGAGVRPVGGRPSGSRGHPTGCDAAAASTCDGTGRCRSRYVPPLRCGDPLRWAGPSTSAGPPTRKRSSTGVPDGSTSTPTSPQPASVSFAVVGSLDVRCARPPQHRAPQHRPSQSHAPKRRPLDLSAPKAGVARRSTAGAVTPRGGGAGRGPGAGRVRGARVPVSTEGRPGRGRRDARRPVGGAGPQPVGNAVWMWMSRSAPVPMESTMTVACVATLVL